MHVCRNTSNWKFIAFKEFWNTKESPKGGSTDSEIVNDWYPNLVCYISGEASKECIGYEACDFGLCMEQNFCQERFCMQIYVIKEFSRTRVVVKREAIRDGLELKGRVGC